MSAGVCTCPLHRTMAEGEMPEPDVGVRGQGHVYQALFVIPRTEPGPGRGNVSLDLS